MGWETIMESTEINDNKQKVKDLRVQISSIKKELNKLNKEKESWYSKRSDFNKQITKLIGGVKGSKDERNEITESVKEHKVQRDTLNKEISEKVKELKVLEKENETKTPTKPQKRVNPEQLKKQIEKMDYVLQTQPMSFDKEQKLMKELKTLKKELVESGTASTGWAAISQLRKDINKLRKKSNKIHKGIQAQAASSQEKHEIVVSASKEIDELKEKEKTAFDKFKEFKDLFVAKNTELKALLKRVDNIKGVLEEHDVVLEEEHKKATAKEMKEKAKEVDKKVKEGKKLTTEDLLVFQRNMK